jgi:hypothetical protein
LSINFTPHFFTFPPVFSDVIHVPPLFKAIAMLRALVLSPAVERTVRAFDTPEYGELTYISLETKRLAEED